MIVKYETLETKDLEESYTLVRLQSKKIDENLKDILHVSNHSIMLCSIVLKN